MDVSIIIINYRTPQLIINCLKSIYQHTFNIKFEIIIVDNDPVNGGGDLIRNSFPEVKWIDMNYNAGFGIANNKGMSIATGSYFLLLNADTLIIDDVIERCFVKMIQKKDTMACGALQYYPDLTPMPFYTSFNNFRKTFFILPPSSFFDNLMNRLYPEPEYNDPEQCDWLVGAFLFLKREGYERTGGFSEDFFMYGEDVEWSGRLGKLGKLCYFKDCRFIHLENKNPFRRTNISWINRFSTQMQVSNLLWVRKQYGLVSYIILILHYVLMIPVVYVWKILLNLKKSGKPFSELKTQYIYFRKTLILLKYFPKTLLLKKDLYKITPSENIDLIIS